MILNYNIFENKTKIKKVITLFNKQKWFCAHLIIKFTINKHFLVEDCELKLFLRMEIEEFNRILDYPCKCT